MSSSPAITASILALSVVDLVLSTWVLRRFLRDRRACHLYWAAGLYLVFVTLVEEAALYAGTWSEPLIQSYLVLVAVLVGVLSLGSADISLPGRWRTVWFGYIVLTSVALAIVGFLYPVSSDILQHGVVWGLPPVPTVVASSLVTYPAAGLLVVSSLYGALRHRRLPLLFIAAGTLVISAAGSLYIVTLPVTLYYAEFVGVALLFLGFVGIPGVSSRPTPPSSS